MFFGVHQACSFDNIKHMQNLGVVLPINGKHENRFGCIWIGLSGKACQSFKLVALAQHDFVSLEPD